MRTSALPDRLDDLPAVWRDDLFTERIWQRHPDRSIQKGEAGGFVVRSPGFPHLAYLKPTKICEENRPRAAYEKIASDLGYEVGLPVPPVLLYRRENAPEKEESRTCISVVVYEEQWEWGDLWEIELPDAAREIMRQALAENSGVVAFDTWLGNADRRNRRNAIFGTFRDAPAQAAFMFLDYSNSLNMGDRWGEKGFETIEVPKLPEVFLEAIDRGVLEEAVSRIESMDDNVINEIVARIPDDYMAPQHAEIVTAGLRARKKIVRDALQGQLRP